MRIESINITNINSLRGEHRLSLESDVYTRGNLFLITGVTGAGKSTILDALTLALYGFTPRIRRGVSEIVSRGQKHAKCEVEFTFKSERYRAQWSLAFKNEASSVVKMYFWKLFPDKQELGGDLPTVLLSEGARHVPEFIAELTGLDFTRFCRSMLLAQGQFSAFLLAPPADRADLLEKLTGTEIFGSISRRVSEIFRDKKQEKSNKVVCLQMVEKQIQEFDLINFETELIATQNEITDKKEQLNDTRQHLEKLKSWEDISKQAENFASKIENQISDTQQLRKAKDDQLHKLTITNVKLVDFNLAFSDTQQKIQGDLLLAQKVDSWRHSLLLIEDTQKNLEQQFKQDQRMLDKYQNQMSRLETEIIKLQKITQKVPETFKQARFKAADPCPVCLSDKHGGDLYTRLEHLSTEESDLKEELKSLQTVIQNNQEHRQTLSIQIADIREKISLTTFHFADPELENTKLQRQKKILEDAVAQLTKDLEIYRVREIKAEEALIYLSSEAQKLEIQKTQLSKFILFYSKYFSLIGEQDDPESSEFCAVYVSHAHKNITQLQDQMSASEQKKGELLALQKRKTALTHQRLELNADWNKFLQDLEHWETLNELIGSPDGTKFRKFAQQLTLEYLITLANQHLERMRSRYRLSLSPEVEMDCILQDLLQGGTMRSVRTLSGGESFLVSLSLALGLSDLASLQNPVQCLFLDEGFGTLDPASLDDVLDAFDHLKDQGKIIGMISHVPSMQDRIPLQIHVTRESINSPWSKFSILT